MKSSLVKAKPKSHKAPSRSGARATRRAVPRIALKKARKEGGILSSQRALPAGALVLAAAILALLAAFHSARDRLAPVHQPAAQARAALPETNLGR